MASPKRPQIEVIKPVMRSIPEGWFWMGYSDGRDDEKPLHRVWVDAFELAAYQTTNEEYARFLEATSHPKPLVTGAGSTFTLNASSEAWSPPEKWNDPEFNHPKQPVVAVSWFDAVAYCEWLSLACGGRYRLPTEAEWERSARGGVEGALYPWGEAPPGQLPNYANRWKNGPEPVGMYSPNAYGLYNLGDNVHEWCSDWYDANYYAVSQERNPQGPAAGSRRASRGGSWRHHIKVTRTAARSSIPPEFKYADYGFRLARGTDAPNQGGTFSGGLQSRCGGTAPGR